MSVRLYRVTLSTGSLYDKANREARSFEGHFKASLRGNIRRNRKRLADFLVPIFQRRLRREFGVRISRGRVRIGVEREQPSLSASRDVSAEFLVISYHGKQHVAKRLPTETFSLPKSRRRRPRKRRLRSRVRVKRRNRTRTKTRTRRVKRNRRLRLG